MTGKAMTHGRMISEMRMRNGCLNNPVVQLRQSVRRLFPMLVRWLFAAFLLCCALPASALQPDSVQASYDVYKDGLKVGQIEETYTRNNDHYMLESITTPSGLMAMFRPEKILVRSSGLIGKRGLQPLLFTHQRGQDISKENRAELDWNSRELTLIHQDQRKTVTLPDGTQDRLSAMYQFMFLPLQKATTLDFSMTNGSKLDNYHYSIIHNRRIKVPVGELDTMYLFSQAKAGETRSEIWLSTQHNNLPCKMVITDADGDQIIQVLSKLDIKP